MTSKKPTPKNPTRESLRQATRTQNEMYKVLVVIALAVLLILSGLYLNMADRYRSLARRDNLACPGIGIGQKNGLVSGYDYEARLSSATAKGLHASFVCLTETVATNTTQFRDGSSFSEGYQLGATVMVFGTDAAAYSYAEKRINPQRWWSPGQDNDGILQTGLFTYQVTDIEQPYVDSYTVRGNAAVSLSMRCGRAGDTAAQDDCDQRARRALDQFAGDVQSRLQEHPL